jgi:hypothetical protein
LSNEEDAIMKHPGKRSIVRTTVVACAWLALAACVHKPDYVKPTATTAGMATAPTIAAPAADPAAQPHPAPAPQ